MNHLMLDRASDAAANDLAEVRKLIEGMNALVHSQIQQQQQALLAQSNAYRPIHYPQAVPNNEPYIPQHYQSLSAVKEPPESPTEQFDLLRANSQDSLMPLKRGHKVTSNHNAQITEHKDFADTVRMRSGTTTAYQIQSEPPQRQSNQEQQPLKHETVQHQQCTTLYTQQDESMATSQPPAGVIVEVTHLTFNRVVYFQLALEASIEPMIAWLRLSFQDAAISGMVLQYKGFDGLWKCLLNRDDSLKRILKQSLKSNTMLQLRVPREQDLISSGYTDRRLIALTKTESMLQ